MKLKRFVSIVIALTMVLSIVPAFNLTASAESIAADAELVFDGAFGVGASTYSVEFTMGGSSFGYKDTGMVDTAGNYIGGFCYAGPSDGFYPADGERSVALSSGFSQTSDTGGSTKWTSGSSRMNITFNILSSSTYEIVYTCDGTYVATVAYSGSPQGITHPLAWKGTGWGGASPAYDNVVITVDGETVYDESNLPDLATASDWYAMEFTLSTGRDGATSGYRDWAIKDADGNQFTGFCFAGTTDGFYPGDRQSLSSGFSLTSTNSDSSTHWTSMSTKMRVAVTKGSGTYTVTYTKIEGGTETELSSFTYSGTPNGISLPYEWATTGGSGSFTFANVQVYAVVPETTKDITATYTVDGTTVKTQTKTIDTSVTSTADFDAYYYSPGNGTNTLYKAAAQTLSDSATIAMTAVENWSQYPVGTEFTNNGTPYKVTSANLIPNGNFAEGINGWYAADGSAASASNFTTDASAGSVYLVGNGGSGSNLTIQRSWAIENGKTYTFVYTQNQAGTDKKWQRFSLGNDFKSNNDCMLSGAGAGDVETGQSVVEGTNLVTFTNTGNYKYANFVAAWSGGVTLSNFGLYEVEVDSSKVANTTIKFVDSSNTSTEIQTAVTITGIVGDVIDLSAYTGAITYNGNPYSFDSSNPANYTVVGNNDVVTLTYTTDAYTGFTGTPVTVIAGNDPVLSTTVTAVTGAGSTTVVDGAVWEDATGLTAGTHTIDGTVTIDGKTINGTVTVDVLPMTFEVDDFTGDSSGATANFPVDVTGDFYVEFDLVATSFKDLWIYTGKDGALWGGGQIGLGWDNQGNGYFRAQPEAQTDVQFETNKKYRFLIHSNVDNATDTYDLVVYDTVTKEVVFTCDDYGYRTSSDLINTIVVTSNGGGGAATLSNIKVYAPNQADAFTTITFVATGSVSETYTTSYTSAEEFPIPHYDGHIMKTRTISGTTVTATYEATTTSIGSWYMRNNFTDDNWITQSKYIGSHDAFADDNTGFRNDGGALYGDTGATSTDSTTVDNSQTQSVRVVDQLNAGVRYFDVRLSRQNDGTFATTHGPAFENFRDVAISMAQWAKENPGEVIILDFQTVRDALYGGSATGHYDVITDNETYYGPDEGDDNQYVYDALVELFADTGLDDFFPRNLGESTWDLKYGDLTNYGTNAVIIPFGKGRAVNCQGNTFYNRSALNNDVTYTNDSSYSDVVSYLDSTYSNLSDGATISTIHAYTTPVSFIGIGDSLLDAAAENNPNWINESGFYNWMSYGKGDVLLMNDSVSDIDLYYPALNSFNRTGANSSSTFNGTFTRTDDNVTITGAQANVPYSTKWTVEPTATTATYTIDGVEYTANTAYTLDLMQFNRDSVQPTGTVNVTFPKLSTDTTTVDVLLSSDGTQVYQTAAVGEAISIDTTALADVILATRVAPGKEYTVNYVAGGTTIYTTTELVPYGQVVYSVPAGDFYLEATDKAYILNSTVASSHTAVESDTTTTFTVDVTVVSENAVLADTFGNNDASTDCNNTENLLFVGSSGISDPGDADAAGDAVMANNGGNVGSPRIPVLMFNVPEVAEGKAVKLHLYVAKANQNLENGSMKLAVNVADVTVDEAAGYAASSLTNTTGVVWSDTMFTAVGDATDGRREVNTWIEVDVTEFVKAATGDTITFTLYAPTAGAYVADREKAVAGGAYEGKAAYLEIVDANTVSVSGATLVVKGGKDVTADAADGILVPEGSTIKVRETGANLIAFTDGTNVYTTNADGWVTLTPSSKAEYSVASLGVTMVDGAQVRIGDGVNADGTVAGNSGLRFITTVDKTDSLAAIDGATFGVEITAESSDKVVDIPTADDKWQVKDEVFTSALTNLAVSNYNRNFTAKPYVSINGTKYYGSEVTRSIYQVASGLLATGYNGSYGEEADKNSDTNYETMPDVLVKVLNGYVNQVGVRLVINEGVLAKSDKYTGTDNTTFFTVTDASTNGTTYTCTLKATGDAKINTELFSTYVRINNNNSKINTLVSVVDNNDGTYTLTFDGSSLVTE
ncbi:MAG: hypothetical protein IJ435_02990 [Clostridia bacterium]|nr:hypothetical protein [Clostridia bacterium]